MNYNNYTLKFKCPSEKFKLGSVYFEEKKVKKNIGGVYMKIVF